MTSSAAVPLVLVGALIGGLLSAVLLDQRIDAACRAAFESLGASR